MNEIAILNKIQWSNCICLAISHVFAFAFGKFIFDKYIRTVLDSENPQAEKTMLAFNQSLFPNSKFSKGFWNIELIGKLFSLTIISSVFWGLFQLSSFSKGNSQLESIFFPYKSINLH